MIGWTARRLLAELPRIAPTIATITTTAYVPRPGLSHRLGLDAKRTRTAPAAMQFVHEALRHRGYMEPIEVLPVESSAFPGEPPPNSVRGICSRVTLRSGRSGQLPLLDFCCEPTEANADA